MLDFITKWGRCYYKARQFFYITKQGIWHYKVGQVLKSGGDITKWDNY